MKILKAIWWLIWNSLTLASPKQTDEADGVNLKGQGR